MLAHFKGSAVPETFVLQPFPQQHSSCMQPFQLLNSPGYYWISIIMIIVIFIPVWKLEQRNTMVPHLCHSSHKNLIAMTTVSVILQVHTRMGY